MLPSGFMRKQPYMDQPIWLALFIQLYHNSFYSIKQAPTFNKTLSDRDSLVACKLEGTNVRSEINHVL